MGEALARYLRYDRPDISTRRVFACMKAPLRGFAGPSTVSTIVIGIKSNVPKVRPSFKDDAVAQLPSLRNFST